MIHVFILSLQSITLLISDIDTDIDIDSNIDNKDTDIRRSIDDDGLVRYLSA